VNRVVVLWTVIPVVSYFVLWTVVTSIAVFAHGFSPIMLLGKITIPSSFTYDAIASAIADPESLGLWTFGTTLFLGTLQYGFIGFVIGLVVKYTSRGRRDA
jgi:hypothetical protein